MRWEIFVNTKSKRKALQVAEKAGLSLPIAVKAKRGGFICYSSVSK